MSEKSLIDLDSDPKVPRPCLRSAQHSRMGQFEWNPAKVELYFSPNQQDGRIRGDSLQEELRRVQVFNANLLDYLLANTHLIPVDWKGRHVFFWGTIYMVPDEDEGDLGESHLAARCLYWDHELNTWDWAFQYIGSTEFTNRHPALVLKE